MKYNIIVEPEAIHDLLNIKSYITNQDTKAKANIFIFELKKTIKTLDEMPQRCRISLYTKSSNTHDIIYKGYTIVYKIIDDNVHILTIFRQRSY
jgi:plasmid stabilization system protein ParE